MIFIYLKTVDFLLVSKKGFSMDLIVRMAVYNPYNIGLNTEITILIASTERVDNMPVIGRKKCSWQFLTYSAVKKIAVEVVAIPRRWKAKK